MSRTPGKKCPECGGRVGVGYGLAGGGVGQYFYCTRATCTWFYKERECPWCDGGVLDVDGKCDDASCPGEPPAPRVA